MDSSTSLRPMQTPPGLTPGQANAHLYDGIALCKSYIAVHGRTPASVAFCDKVLRNHGIDPDKVPGYRVSSTAPTILGRPGAQVLPESRDKAEPGAMRRATLEGPGPLGPMCGIAYNSSVAELREILERMGLAMTSSSLGNVSQALDSNGGHSVLNDPELFDMEQAILLKHCLICLDKDLEPSHLYPILGALHSIASTYRATLMVHTDDQQLSVGRCVANMKQPSCILEAFDPCAPQALLQSLDKQHAHTGPGAVIPVFISDANNLKLIEASYPKPSLAEDFDDNATVARVTLTIREYAYRTERPDCQPKPVGDPPAAASYGLPLGLSLSALAVLLIGVGFGARERIPRSREVTAPLEAVPNPQADSSVTTTVENAELEASAEGSGGK